MTFIASNALSCPLVMSSVGVNNGGWANYPLNTYLNNRLYGAFSSQWKQLMKQVKVKSSIGNKSTELSSSDCYIFIPSISEIDTGITSEPYASEGTHISHFVSSTSKICHTPDGTAVQYWTRSPNVAYDTYVYRISNTGTSQGVTLPYLSDVYVRIMISM